MPLAFSFIYRNRTEISKGNTLLSNRLIDRGPSSSLIQYADRLKQKVSNQKFILVHVVVSIHIANIKAVHEINFANLQTLLQQGCEYMC